MTNKNERPRPSNNCNRSRICRIIIIATGSFFVLLSCHSPDQWRYKIMHLHVTDKKTNNNVIWKCQRLDRTPQTDWQVRGHSLSPLLQCLSHCLCLPAMYKYSWDSRFYLFWASDCSPHHADWSDHPFAAPTQFTNWLYVSVYGGWFHLPCHGLFEHGLDN